MILSLSLIINIGFKIVKKNVIGINYATAFSKSAFQKKEYFMKKIYSLCYFLKYQAKNLINELEIPLLRFCRINMRSRINLI